MPGGIRRDPGAVHRYHRVLGAPVSERKGQRLDHRRVRHAAGSTGGGRKRREIGKRDGRSVEIQRLIGRSLRAAVDLERMGEASIIVDCDVIQADGGTRTAAISGGYVALVDALWVLCAEQNRDPAELILGPVAAVSVGVVDGAVHCDLDYALDSRADVDMNVVMRGTKFVEVQGTGERDSFDRSQLDILLDSAAEGIAEIYRSQAEVLGIADPLSGAGS
jgi:ribonuclease PH